ncbi:hypothetical protein DL764_005602 [Monosporascus ibericus]|uniref:PHD-type domain-containing protein n=1 Tax=Monosporascus ibericus TaxID=155417 RepID=A0A4Q4T8J0_9PEZI|nr:hypothetical protein DL764_005602 [Monosporascus ibericus]
MADTLNRRSSRARTSQSQSHNSSTTSSTSGRAERSTRAFAKTGSPIKSTGSGSLSSEPPEDTNSITNDDTIVRRRSMRGKDEERDKQPKIELLDMAPAVDDAQDDDDEAVRCICGHDEYPGPPPFDQDAKHGLKDPVDYERIFGIEITDEMAGNFVQCEICNSWQHSACVGFTTEESNPDDVEYFCEQCRKDLHKVYTASNGQKYSIFLPIHRTSRAASRATSTTKDGARSPKVNGSSKNSRSSAAAYTSKRRSTMNSRDAAYDEEEQLRRAIEASKEDAIVEEPEPALTRRPKRGRDGSEEKLENVKRQRTDSKSPSPATDKPPSAGRDDSEDESSLRNGSKKSRNTTRNTREKTERDERREEQERKRAEAANSDPSEELPLAARAAANRATESVQPPDPPASSQPRPDTPPTAQATASSNKKKGTSQHKKGKGRNQYTKDRDNHDHDDSPARSLSRDVTRNADENTTSHSKPAANDSSSKHSNKSKGGMNSRVTMSDMKRRANNILEYISRTQIELANDPLAESKASPAQNTTDYGSADPVSHTKINGDGGNRKADNASLLTNGSAAAAGLSLKEFKDMSCVEMMDALARDLVKWQQEFAS